MARTLTLRLDDETAAALADQEAENPNASTAEIIREAIGSPSSVVYFVRRSDKAVKIGYTTSLKTRFSELRSEYGQVTLEASMPGGRVEELAVHHELAKERLGRPGTEWFQGVRTEKLIKATVVRWGKPDEITTSTSTQRLVPMHVLVPRALFDKLLVKRDMLRKTSPMVSLSEAVRVILEDVVREKR